nr:unnamed protein product [Callosobruchus chinensis]
MGNKTGSLMSFTRRAMLKLELCLPRYLTSRPEDPISVRWFHLALLVEFALELKKALQSINEQSFNHFELKFGINHGPITAGVIGASKPHYDIWGNTVNVASRMESTGKTGVTQETMEILKHFGYQFEQRGMVTVKGKGQLMTYYLAGKGPKTTPPTAPVSPSEEKTVIECSDRMDDDVFTTESEIAPDQALMTKGIELKDSSENTLLLSDT